MMISRMIPILTFVTGLTSYGGNLASPAPPASSDDGGYVTVGGSRVHFLMLGEGKIPVVFVSGLGEDLRTWEHIQDSIAHNTRTLSYDRAGLGKSGYHDQQKDLTSLARELDSVIVVTRIGSPAILVGHSLGCQIVKRYASLHPDLVAGIMFLDPGYDESLLRESVTDSVWVQREKALKKYLPEFNVAQEMEWRNLNAICREADGFSTMPDVPIVLMTATRINPEFPGSRQELDVKKAAHERWLNELPAAKHLLVPGSRHYVQDDVPALVIAELRRMITGK